MLKIGVTGNIGSGKSEFEKIVNELGYKSICADRIVHGLYLNKEIQKIILGEFLTLERKEIGKIIFKDKNKRKILEKILHPFVENEIKLFFENNNGGFVFVPLLYETGFEKLFDKVILITSDENIRLKRIMKRDNIDIDTAQAKIQSQIPQEEKLKFADIVIENNSNIKELKNSFAKLKNQIQ